MGTKLRFTCLNVVKSSKAIAFLPALLAGAKANDTLLMKLLDTLFQKSESQFRPGW